MGKFLNVEKIKDITVLSFEAEEVLITDAENIKKELSDLIDAGTNKIVIDFSHNKYISSLILASLIFAQKRVKEAGGNLRISGLHGHVEEIFRITNLDKVFDTYNDKMVAVRSFGNTD